MAMQPNSPEARDVAYLLHPYTKLKTHEKTGPLIMSRGEGFMSGTTAAINISKAWPVCGRPPSVLMRNA